MAASKELEIEAISMCSLIDFLVVLSVESDDMIYLNCILRECSCLIKAHDTKMSSLYCFLRLSAKDVIRFKPYQGE
jgi:hypothetical protein